MPRKLVMSSIALALLSLVFVVSPFGLKLRHTVDHQFGYQPVAVYGNIKLSGYQKVTGVYYDSEVAPTIPLFLSLPTGEVVETSTLSESMAERSLSPRVHKLVRDTYTYYSDFHRGFRFVDGRLRSARIEGTSSRFKIGPTKDGPFVALPIDHETMIKLFGKPDRWERDYIEGGV